MYKWDAPSSRSTPVVLQPVFLTLTQNFDPSPVSTGQERDCAIAAQTPAMTPETDRTITPGRFTPRALPLGEMDPDWAYLRTLGFVQFAPQGDNEDNSPAEESALR